MPSPHWQERLFAYDGKSIVGATAGMRRDAPEAVKVDGA
jgi:hypothetical protein